MRAASFIYYIIYYNRNRKKKKKIVKTSICKSIIPERASICEPRRPRSTHRSLVHHLYPFIQIVNSVNLLICASHSLGEPVQPSQILRIQPLFVHQPLYLFQIFSLRISDSLRAQRVYLVEALAANLTARRRHSPPAHHALLPLSALPLTLRKHTENLRVGQPTTTQPPNSDLGGEPPRRSIDNLTQVTAEPPTPSRPQPSLNIRRINREIQRIRIRKLGADIPLNPIHNPSVAPGSVNLV